MPEIIRIQDELNKLLQRCFAELANPALDLDTLTTKHQKLLDQFFQNQNINDIDCQQAMIRQAADENLNQ